MKLSRYLKIYPCPDRLGMNLVYSTRRSSSVLLSDTQLRAAEQGLLPDNERQTLERLGVVVSDPATERQEMANIFETANASKRPLSAIVVLNLDCNLACPYCYEGNFRGRNYMASQTSQKVVEIASRYFDDGRNVAFTFYGGEPLLSFDLIREMSLPLNEMARNAGVSYSFSLVTNGTLLTRRKAEELVPLGLAGVKFTVDGPRDVHDRCRPFASGKGSFDIIINNIKEIWDLLPVQIGGNFTQENWREFPRLLDELAAREITPEKVAGISFSPVSPKAGDRGISDFGGECSCTYEPWLYEATLLLREATLRAGFAVPKPRISTCMVEFDDNLVINYDGSLYKCPVFMGYEHLKIGSVHEGREDYRRSHGIDIWRTEKCLDCSYLPLCFGGCRFMTLLRDGAIKGVDCRKDLLDATLEKTIRQDLQYQRSRRPL